MSSALLCGILNKSESLDPVNALLLALIGIVIVFIVLIVLMLLITLLGKVVDKTNELSKKKQAAVENVTNEVVEEKEKEYATGSCGELTLVKVEDREAAMIMAIVADELKTPLNELRFKSIKRVDEEEQK